MADFSRSYIREGDSTTTGGRVQPKPQPFSITYGGAKAAFEGDPVWCPACKSYGVTRCVPPFRRDTGPDGRQRNLNGDLCLCKCPKPPRLVALFSNVTAGFSSQEMLGMPGSAGWLAHAGHAPGQPMYDERVQLVGAELQVLAGMPYFLEISDGRTLFGNADDQGQLPRIETDGEAEYIVYWGDEALAKIRGASE